MTGYDPEAVYQDADIEQAEMIDLGNRIHQLNEKGVCTHDGWVGVSTDGTIYYPVQERLSGQQVGCTQGCGKVFDTEADLIAERREVLA